MAVVAGVACRSDYPVQRGQGDWAYDSQVARGAWDEDVKSGWVLGFAVFQGDHLDRSDTVMASTDNGTLDFDLVDVGNAEFLTFTADLLEDGDRDRTPYMDQAVKQLRSRRIKQVSAGFIVDEMEWELADADNGLPRDRMTVVRARLMEVSLVIWGAQGDEAAAAIVAQALSRGSVASDEHDVRLQEGPMRLMQMRGDEPVPFDAKASRDAASAERQAARAAEIEKTAAKTERAQIASARARDRTARGIGG